MSKRRIRLVLLVQLLCTGLNQIQAQQELNVLEGWHRFSNASDALYRHLSAQAFKLLDARAEKIARLQSGRDWQDRQRVVKSALTRVLGPFPPKTPLNAKTVSVIERPGFRIEKVLFESRPQFYVTAVLLIPLEIMGKAPGIIYCSGHSAEGFRSEVYQHVIFNLVKKGFVVLAFDPVGQGERLEYFDPELGRSRVGGPTSEHSVAGTQAFLAGRSQAHYMVWDGIRAVDYLTSRPEVDPERVGITGRSGGGTQSAYIAAVDDRIYAAAPECYITSFRRLLESIGPQDAEQNFYHGLLNGLDHADLLEVRAPRPTLLIATTRDFFSIQGVTETAEEVQRAYKALGKPNHFSVATDDAPHASTEANREAMYAFFQDHLGLPGSSEDTAVEILDPRELEVTTTGQVSTALDSHSVFSLNSAKAAIMCKSLEEARKVDSDQPPSVLDLTRKLSGFSRPAGSDSPPIFMGRVRRDDYSVEKHALAGEGDYVLPFLLFRPDKNPKGVSILYLHPGGKSAEAAVGGEIEELVQAGYTVLAPDLLGVGELGSSRSSPDSNEFRIGSNWREWFAAILIGRSITGIQAGDVIRLVDFLKDHEAARNGEIIGVARGELAPAMLHAAAFEPRIARVALLESLISYRAIAMNRFYQPRFVSGLVAGALTAYDLPDLMCSLTPRGLLLLDLVDHRGVKVRPQLIDKELSVLKNAYRQDRLVIRSSTPEEKVTMVLLDWL